MDLRITLSDINDIEKFKECGVNGLIVGMEFFSDRFNKLFSYDDLSIIVNDAKKFGLDVFVSVNVMIEESDLYDLRKHLIKLLKFDLKGIYFNDFAVLQIADELNFKHLLIYQSDTLMTNAFDAQVLMQEGIQACVIAKELTLKEVLNIASRADYFEFIVHGYINLSYSKRNFLTSYYNFLKVDRQVIENFNLKIKEDTRDGLMPIIETKYGTSVYSDTVLCSFNELLELKKYLKAAIVDDIFLSKEEIFDALYLYMNLNEESAKFSFEKLQAKYPDTNYGTCFYYDKTARKKEEL